jgi:hypothetical protein
MLLDMEVLIIVLIALSGVSNAVMDTLVHHYNSSIFRDKNVKFWNPKDSWMNKWIVDIDGSYKERFVGSSTVFVWTTDGWHLFQFLMLKFIFLAVVFYDGITGYKAIDFVLLHTVFSVSFEVSYKYILIKK